MADETARTDEEQMPARPGPTAEQLRQELEQAPVVTLPVHRDQQGSGDDRSPPREAAKPDGAAGGKGGGTARRNAEHEIFDNCPVTPLGVCGKFRYFLDVNGQLQKVDKLGAQEIMGLFGHRMASLTAAFPQFENIAERGDPPILRPKRNRFDQTSAAMRMHEAVSACGVFEPNSDVRGVGAWTDDDGELIYHLGDAVLYRGDRLPPGRIDGKIYPAAPPVAAPDFADGPDPVPEILRMLGTWNWTRDDLHPVIALGLIAAQFLGGALDWRPTFWLTAPAGAGKSEFQRFIEMLHGERALIQSTDATKSGITSQLGHASLPVAVDELEPGDERSTKEKDIITLARVASSGGQWLRGSADQSGVGGKVYSTFLFSSILIPGVMKTQDVQRLIRLELNPIPKGAAKLGLRTRTWRSRGARLKAFLIERWASFPERLAVWRHALELADVTGRDADNWGTVLALADMARSEDVVGEDEAASMARKVAFQVTADKADTVNDAEAMLLHLMSQTYDPFRRGEQFNIAQWVAAAAGLPGAPKTLYNEAGGPMDKSDQQRNAQRHLSQLGLRVYDEPEPGLFIMNKPIAPLVQLFQGSQWSGGAWKQSASRVPGAVQPPHPPTLARITSRGWIMPLKAIPGMLSFPMDPANGTAGASRPGHDELEDYR